jgi:voltage-gated potassium channel
MKKPKKPVDNQKGGKSRVSDIRKKISVILENPEEGGAARFFNWFLISLISLNIVAVIVTSIKDIHNKDYQIFYYIEVISIVIFTIEYLLRIWTAFCNTSPNSKKTSIGYIFSFYGIVDLLAILPFYLSLFTFIGIDLRILRGFRLLRVLKLGRYNDSLQKITKVFKREKDKLITTFFVMIILVLLASSMMYFFETEVQPEKFPSIPATLWWAVATLTTVGYGDIYPITVLGKILGGIISILGIGLVAMPSGIIAMGLIQEIRSSPADPENIHSVLTNSINIWSVLIMR